MSKNENQPDDNKVAIGRKIFNQIKYHLETNGQSMAVDKFPPDFPISRRSCYHIARGGGRNWRHTRHALEKKNGGRERPSN